MLLPMRQGAITGRKKTTLVMQENVLLQSGGYHISGFTCMVDVSSCKLTINLLSG
jgi:hypothetical protein